MYFIILCPFQLEEDLSEDEVKQPDPKTKKKRTGSTGKSGSARKSGKSGSTRSSSRVPLHITSAGGGSNIIEGDPI